MQEYKLYQVTSTKTFIFFFCFLFLSVSFLMPQEISLDSLNDMSLNLKKKKEEKKKLEMELKEILLECEKKLDDLKAEDFKLESHVEQLESRKKSIDAFRLKVEENISDYNSFCQGEFPEDEYYRRLKICALRKTRIEGMIESYNIKLQEWSSDAKDLLNRREELKREQRKLMAYYESLYNNKKLALDNINNSIERMLGEYKGVVKEIEDKVKFDGQKKPPEAVEVGDVDLNFSDEQLDFIIKRQIKDFEEKSGQTLTDQEKRDLYKEAWDHYRKKNK